MNIRASCAWVALLVFVTAALAEEPRLETPIALTHVTIVTSPDDVTEDATILIADGRIVALGVDVEIPPGTRVIDAAGQYAYPGFVDGLCRTGVESVEATETLERRYESDFPSISEQPQIRTVEANRSGIFARLRAERLLTIERDTFAKNRQAGFTSALIAPPRAIIGGQTALTLLGDQPVRDSVLRAATAQLVSFAIPPQRTLKDRAVYPGTLLGVVAHLRQVFHDARWYAQTREFMTRHPDRAVDLPLDPDLEALQPVLFDEQLAIWEADSADEIHRVLDLAAELGIRELAIAGGREAYKTIERLKQNDVLVIVSLDLPREPRKFELRAEELLSKTDDGTFFGKEWDKRPYYPERAYEQAGQERKLILENPQRLEEAGVRWCFTTVGLKKLSEAPERINEFIEAGLAPEAALRALTSTPATALAGSAGLGALRGGARANVTVLSAELGDQDARVKRVIIDGRDYEIIDDDSDEAEEDAEDADDEDEEPETEALAVAETEPATAEAPAEPPVATAIDALKTHTPDWPIETDADRVPAIRTGGSVLLENAMVLTVSGDDLPQTSVLIEDGKITQIGRGIEAPADVRRINLSGYVVMPGIIDPHSHTALRAINEWSMSVTPEVRVADVIRSDDPAIYWALAGGVTVIHTMHGSANTIGGQNIVLKLKYGRPAAELLMPGQPRTVKFALGENVKRQGMTEERWDMDAPRRFPGTRMGVEAVLRRALFEGRRYSQQRREYARALAANEDVTPMRRDLRLEALADIIDGGLWINAHCYRADETLRLLAVAEEFGVRVAALHHVLEGYRVMPEIARHGCATVTFADWWAYKIEAYDAVPQNAGMMLKYGINSTIKSDSDDLMRHMNHEAAKCAKYSGLTPNEALRLVTINAARVYGLEDRIGSIEVGKDADIAVFDGHPLDTFSKCVLTLVDGEAYFTHPSFDPSDPAAPRTIKSFSHGGRQWKDVKGKTPLTVNPRFREDDTPRAAAADRDPPDAYAIVHATVHPISGPPIEDGTVVLRGGLIEAVGANVAVPGDAEVIDAIGLHVWPGLINAATNTGMQEIAAVGVTVDTGESGTFQPDVTAVSALNPHSAMIEIARAEGITTALLVPNGPAIGGQAGLVDLAGWTMPEMLIEPRVGLVVRLPSTPPQGLWEEPAEKLKHEREHDPNQPREPIEDTLDQLEAFFRNARLYAEATRAADGSAAIDREARYEAMVPYALGEKPVLFQADSYKQILEALMFADRFELRPIILGGREAWKLVDMLAERDVPVIHEGVFGMPARLPSLANASDAWDGNYRGLRTLAEGGVRFCLAHRGADLAKLMPLEAGFAIAHGLNPDAAVRAMTLSAAEILGVDDRLGSLEVGKIANLIVTTDHPCQATNVVKHAFIRGKPVSLAGKHTRSAAKFADRPRPDLPPARTDLVGPPSRTR